MILPHPREAVHKAWLYRLLAGLLDRPLISRAVVFKGGTCAAMLGWLDRFSVDLDFDLKPEADKKKLRSEFRRLFRKSGLEIKDESRKTLQFFLSYPSSPGQRNTIKLDIIDQTAKTGLSRPYFLAEIQRYAVCQTLATMFSHKLITIQDRYGRTKSLAGRDLYDAHYFFFQGFGYRPEVIEERSSLKTKEFLMKLVDFIEKRATQTVIDQDLNPLLPLAKFQQIRKVLKKELLVFLVDEIKRLSL